MAKNSNNLNNFFGDYGGFIIGVVIGLLCVLFKVVDVLIAIVVVFGLGLIGAYTQKNKDDVKTKLKDIIEKW